MKLKIVAVILCFSATSLAQTSGQPKANPNQPQSSATASAESTAKCPCCEKMSGAKDSEMCCAHHDNASSDSGMSRCQGKDGKDAVSCTKGDAGCCGDKACGKNQEGCCAQSGKDSESKMSCCAGNHEHGDMAHGHCGMMGEQDHGEMNK